MKSDAVFLYENLSLLCNFHEPSKNFKELLKPEMFDNPNKTGMLQTLHFLLPIFKPDIFKTSIVWPVYTLKDEAVFRGAIVKFIGEYNAKHQLFELPKILPSLLSSAGGPKFINFMLELSTAALTLILKTNNKDAFKACEDFKALDRTDQSSVYADLKTEQDLKTTRDKESTLRWETLHKEAREEIDELKNECNCVANQLTQLVTESQYLSLVDRKSFLDIESTSCIEKRIRKLDERENEIAVKMERTSNFKEIINKFSVIVQQMVLAKDKRTVLDGSIIIPDELMPIVNELSNDKWLIDSESMYEGNKIRLTGLIKFCEAAAEQQLGLLQQLLVKFKNADIIGMSEQLDALLEQLRSKNTEVLNLKSSSEEMSRAFTKRIETIEEDLFDFEPDSRFQTLLAPSPCVTMPTVEAKEDDDNTVYECLIDSPFVKNFVQNLIKKIKADSKRNGNHTTCDSPSAHSFVGRPNFNVFPHHSSPIASTFRSNLVHRRKLCSPSSPFSPMNGNGSLLNQSTSSNTAHQPESDAYSYSEVSGPGAGHTWTPVSSRNAGQMSSASPSTPVNTGEDAEKEFWSPRGIYKLNASNDEVDAELERLSEHFVPKTPMHRRQSFLNLMERYQRLKVSSTVNEHVVNENTLNGSTATESTLNGDAVNGDTMNDGAMN